MGGSGPIPKSPGWSALALVLILAAVIAAASPTPVVENTTQAPTVECDRVAAVDGADDGLGTAARPLRTAQALVDSLRPGQVGCLRAGAYADDDQVEIGVPRITLRSYGGERATVRGRLWVQPGADGVKIEGLNLDGRNSAALPSPTVNAADVALRGNDITNEHTGICVSVGSPTYGRARHTVIEDNRIHDCGREPSTNKDHGIYVNSSDGAVIRGNWIYDNVDRGLQLYPDAQGTRVFGNVIEGNGEGVNLGGDEASASSDNLVEGNVIAGATIRSDIEGYWAARVGTGNVVRRNCIGATLADGTGGIAAGRSGIGFRAFDNATHVPDLPEWTPAEGFAGAIAGLCSP